MNVTKSVTNVSGNYACNVTNQAGWNASYTSLHILGDWLKTTHDYFSSNNFSTEAASNAQKLLIVQAFFGENASLNCLNNGLKHEISWQKYDSKKEKKILIDKKKFPNIEILNNGSLIIK